MTRLGFLVRFGRGQGIWILGGLVLAILTALANVVLLAVSGWFLTGMALAGATGASFNYFLPAAVIRGCAILRAAGRYGERLLTHEAMLRLVGRARARLFADLARRPPRAPDPSAPSTTTAPATAPSTTTAPATAPSTTTASPHSADAATRLGSDLDTLQGLVLGIVLPALVALVIGLGAVTYTLGVAPALALVLAAGLLAGGVILPLALDRAGRRAGQRAIAARADLAVAVTDGVQGQDELWAFGALDRHRALLLARDNALRAARRRGAMLDALGAGLLPLVTQATLWGLVAAGLPLVLRGSLPPEGLVMLAFLGFAAFEPLAPLPQAITRLGAVLAALDRLRGLVGADHPAQPTRGLPPAPEDPTSHDETRADAPAGPRRSAPPLLRLAGVSAIWPGSRRPAVKGLSLTLSRGERLGLVGASGAGKSSLVALIAGDLVPTAGRLWTAPGLRLAVAPQSPVVLSDSLRHNLTLGAEDPTLTDAALAEALDRVHLTDWAAGLPQGLETPLGTGGRALSGGEARRLGMARALLFPAPLLVLDEPGEGLDPATEAAVLAAVLATAAARDQAVILITHRPQGLEHLDRVVYLDDGRVLEAGPPLELARTPGPFHHFLTRSAV